MIRLFLPAITTALLISSCNVTVKKESSGSDEKAITSSPSSSSYFDLPDSLSKNANVRMITIDGKYKVWTKQFGNGPIKVLLLHGGPAMTHEYMECFESFFPEQGFEFYEYDQLGSYYSDQPTDSSLWTTDRFVDEVEQVRKA